MVQRSWLRGTVVALGVGLVLSGSWADAQFQSGQVVTYIQDDWGVPALPPGALVLNYFSSVYAPTLGFLEIGIPGSSGYSILYTSGSAVTAYLPSSGAPASLNADLVDPTSSSSGVFGGQVTALSLNVDFSDAGHILGTLGVPFGDLVLHDVTTLPQVNGLSVRQVLAQANTLLGGGSVGYGVSEGEQLARDLNGSFSGGVVSPFAQAHLRVVSTVNAVPEPGEWAAMGILAGGLGALVVRKRRRG